MNKLDTRHIPTLTSFIKSPVTRKDPLRDTGESGDAYDAEAKTEAQLALGSDAKALSD